MNFDQTLIALCEKHDFTAISVHVSRSEGRPNGFYAYSNAFWTALGGSASACSYGHGDNAAEAIKAAIASAYEMRAPRVEVPALELDEVPA